MSGISWSNFIMTIKEVRLFYQGLDKTWCLNTDRLVEAGYQQLDGGYIARAKREGMVVDYRNNSPTQYWHLMSYCDSKKDDDIFSKRIVCGELIFWMAEVSGSIPPSDLAELANRIIMEPIGKDGNRPIYDRKKWNTEIQRLFFDRICKRVELFKKDLEARIEYKDRYLKKCNASNSKKLSDDKVLKFFLEGYGGFKNQFSADTLVLLANCLGAEKYLEGISLLRKAFDENKDCSITSYFEGGDEIVLLEGGTWMNNIFNIRKNAWDDYWRERYNEIIFKKDVAKP